MVPFAETGHTEKSSFEGMTFGTWWVNIKVPLEPIKWQLERHGPSKSDPNNR